MRTVVIDVSDFNDPKELHAYLKEQLSFPDYYGHNLDALHDVLTEVTEDTLFLTAAADQEFETRFMAVLRDAAEENRHITLKKKPKNRKDGRRH